jgi:hypothetical protein
MLPRRAGEFDLLCTFRVANRRPQGKQRFPLYPQKQTLELSRVMSALCQKRTLAHLLDHLVSGHLQRQRQLQAKCLGSLEVDDELEFRRLLYWKVGRSLAFEDAVYVRSSTFELVDAVNTIRDQPAVLSKRKLAL